uniref:Chromogranin-A n=1 Tax=Stegastes partitus TaxID=144197 RepID=A0A3B5A1A7_9TELE
VRSGAAVVICLSGDVTRRPRPPSLVMKCIVEALADVLSRQQHVPVSQDCLETLKTDDRLVTILRHHSFLKELQEIAVQGEWCVAGVCSEWRWRSFNHKKLCFLFFFLPGGEQRDALRNKSKEKRVHVEEEEEEEKRSGVVSHKQDEDEEEEEEEVKRGSRENPRRWSKRTKALQVKRKEVQQQHEVPHHSKKLTEEEEEQEEEQKKKKRGANHRSPEEKELQMIAQRPPEEEGSASRKSEVGVRLL